MMKSLWILFLIWVSMDGSEITERVSDSNLEVNGSDSHVHLDVSDVDTELLKTNLDEDDVFNLDLSQNFSLENVTSKRKEDNDNIGDEMRITKGQKCGRQEECPRSLTCRRTCRKKCVRGLSMDMPPALKSFPSSMPLKPTNFDNWAEDNLWENVWTAYPTSTEDVIQAANWANRSAPWKLRPSGSMHSWSPITLPLTKIGANDTVEDKPLQYGNSSPDYKGTDGGKSKYILLKTSKLAKMGIISKTPEEYSFWAEPGIKMDDLLQRLEDQGMGFAHHPAVGEVTLGGVIAIGGHGAGIPAKNERQFKGHTFGSISNLIIRFTAIVYDANSHEFVAKTFERSDSEAKVFLVNMGQTFMTNVTLRAGPLQYMRCKTFMDISAAELFADPKSLSGNARTFSRILERSGRVETIHFPFTASPWLKVWRVVENPRRLPADMFFSRRVRSPYNYPFEENMNPALAAEIQLAKSKQNEKLAMAIGPSIYKFILLGLTAYKSWDIWGPSKNVMLYIKPTTVRYHCNGYAFLTRREDVQRALYESNRIYQDLFRKYQLERKFPINGPVEIRVTGLDKPEDVGIEGAQSPAISVMTPVEGRDELNTVTWFDILTYTRTAYTCDFMEDFETELLKVFDGQWAVLRVEWSKGYAYNGSEKKPWNSERFLNKQIPNGYPQWKYFENTISKYDGSRQSPVFSNDYFNKLG